MIIGQTKDSLDAIATPRLLLEPLTRAHAAPLYAGLQSPEIYRFIADHPPASLEKLTERYAFLEGRRSADGAELWLNWAIRLITDDCYIGYFQTTVGRDSTASIAYVLFPRFWRRGYAKEAGKAVLAFIFRSRIATRISASTDTRNEASIGLLKSLGFTRTETIIGADKIRGEPSDDHIFELKTLTGC